MPRDTTLSIRQDSPVDGKYPIRLTLKRPDPPHLEAQAKIEFALTPQEQEDLRWYLEDYLHRAKSVEEAHVKQIENFIQQRGVELYEKILEGSRGVRRIFDRVLDELADLRIEIRTGIAEAASIPWELMRDPESDSAIALRAKSFVRVQSDPNIGFVKVPQAQQGRVRLLYVVCRPSGSDDVELRAVVNRLLQDLGEELARFDINALRPPTFEALQKELADAKQKGRPYHIVHFDGHGVYAELEESVLKDWLAALSHLTLGGKTSGKHGFLLFESPQTKEKIRPVDGQTLGKLLHDSGVPILVLNACQSAMHEAVEKPDAAETVHDEVRAIGSLAQTVVDQGIPAVLGMRYSVFVVTAAQYIGELYRALAQGGGFGQAASQGRKHLSLNPERWLGLQPRPLQDWFVPVVYEAAPIRLLPAGRPVEPGQRQERDPVQLNPALVRYVPDVGFVGRDETLLMLDRALDDHPIVLLHAYAGQGKTTTAVEFARWYAQTGGLGEQPVVLLTSFESHTDLEDVLNQIGQPFAQVLQASGIEWHALNDTAERRNLVLQILRQVPVLWIWDNVELVAGFPEGTESAWTEPEQTELAEFLMLLKEDKATKVKILITSRRDEQRWLSGIPYRVQMPRMTDADAVRLALVLGEERKLTRREVAQWQPLLDYCAGNPLTLRVIAGQAVRTGLRDRAQIEQFIQAVRDGEQHIQDADQSQGRDRSLGASLDYGFRHAFKEDELPVIALLHLFQGSVVVEALQLMGVGDHALPEVQGRTNEHLTGLLERASETGLLAHLGSTYYTIHPALPWFLRQLFADHYDGQNGRSSAQAALRAWVEAVGGLGNHYTKRFVEGNRDVIQLLALEEANLLRARRLARRHGWWDRVTSAMQGLRILYQYQGRGAEWARLVAEIVPDYCTEDDGPVPGREHKYSLVMAYRVDLAKDQERDLSRAAALQERVVAWNRQQAKTALALPEDATLDDDQRNRIRTLAVSLETLGSISREQGSGECVKQYDESIRHCQRIKDNAEEAINHFNLGHAYREIPDIRDLDAADACYRRELALLNPNDASGRATTIEQIGIGHHERFRDALKQNEPQETLLKHARAAEEHYLQALSLCPVSAIADLGPIYHQSGALYADVGQTEQARDHFEKAAQCFEQSGNRHSAGTTRNGMAVMYMRAAGREENAARQRDVLLRAQAYAQAALRDYQVYEGRAAADEAKAQQLIDGIGQALAKLPP